MFEHEPPRPDERANESSTNRREFIFILKYTGGAAHLPAKFMSSDDPPAAFFYVRPKNTHPKI